MNSENITICFAHPAYQMATVFAQRELGIEHFQVWDQEALRKRIGEADVLVVSGLWTNELLELASKLKFVQSISAGVNQYDLALVRERGVRLASAAGVNANAVSEHALAHILAFARLMHTGRDNQHKRHFRGLISDLSRREDELGGKTVLIVGLGRIGQRVAKLAKAFDMRVFGTKRQVDVLLPAVDKLHTPDQLSTLLPQADYVVLTCPLTPETENLIDESALAAMQPGAYLINMARGRVVDEPALIAALNEGAIAGAGLDCMWEEPLSAESPLWAMENVIITPHSAGETRQYESNVIEILVENIGRLSRGETTLVNQIV